MVMFRIFRPKYHLHSRRQISTIIERISRINIHITITEWMMTAADDPHSVRIINIYEIKPIMMWFSEFGLLDYIVYIFS